MTSVTFPTGVVWAFNPTFITVSGASRGDTVNVTVGGFCIKSVLHDSSTRIYIHRLLQLCFSSPNTERSKTVSVTVTGADTWSASLVVIWGAIGVSDNYCQFANSDGVRRVQYFNKFPCNIDYITSGGISSKAVTTTETFNITTPRSNTLTIKIESRNETEGVYLRWIDRFGCRQYFLFCGGDINIKNSLSENNIEDLTHVYGNTYQAHSRPMSITTVKSYAVSAVNLDRDTLAYVSSIVGSPIVDMYLGNDASENEIWVPVIVSEGTYKYSNHHLKYLQDFVITIELSRETSQSL